MTEPEMKLCSPLCTHAHHSICRCTCGGKNHGVMRLQWEGFFCEDCRMSFGKSARAVWDHGCHIQCGSSKRFLTKQGNPQIAGWCRDCMMKYPYWAKWEAA